MNFGRSTTSRKLSYRYSDSWSKAKLSKYCLENVAFQTAHHHCGGGEFIALGDTEPVEFMLYLYFEARACFRYSRLLDRLETILKKSTTAPSLRSSAVRNAQRTTPPTCATKPLTESVFISKSNTRTHTQTSSIAPAHQPTAMIDLRGFFTPVAIRSALRISFAG
jgi:hypothetical protein